MEGANAPKMFQQLFVVLSYMIFACKHHNNACMYEHHKSVYTMFCV